MKKINEEKMSMIKGGKFFGNATKCTPDCFEGTRICHETFYFFWIPFSKEPYHVPC